MGLATLPSLAPPVGGNVLALVGVVLPARQQRRRPLVAIVHARRLRSRQVQGRFGTETGKSY